MKIYTRTGDSGETGLFGGPRVAKDSARIEAYGTVDELNAVLGLARAAQLPAELAEMVAAFQHQLFGVGSILAAPDPNQPYLPPFTEERVAGLEAWIDQLEAQLPPLTQFILPAGDDPVARLHVARAVCRRAERRVVTLVQGLESEAPEEHLHRVIRYLNRLGDLLFVMARRADQLRGGEEQVWDPWLSQAGRDGS